MQIFVGYKNKNHDQLAGYSTNELENVLTNYKMHKCKALCVLAVAVLMLSTVQAGLVKFTPPQKENSTETAGNETKTKDTSTTSNTEVPVLIPSGNILKYLTFL